jgi:hypothetical protein
MINLSTDLKPFDVLTFYSNPSWYDVMGWSTQLAIQLQARNYLSSNSDWYPHHSQIFFAPDKIYRAVPPTLCWDTVDAMIARGEQVKVFRPAYPFTDADAQEMIKLFETPQNFTKEGIARTETIIGSSYDVATDIMIGLNGLLGHPDNDNIDIDNGSRLICSAGCALAFEIYRQNHPGCYPRFFSKIQEAAFKDALWGSEIVRDYQAGNQLQIMDTTPADLANTSTHFGSELIYIGQNF